MAKMHGKTLAFHGGKDLATYPDGLAMAADWQKELRWHWEQNPRQEVQDAVKRHGLKKGRPEIKLPKDLLEHKDGLGVFRNPDEGKEIMTHFTTLVAAMKKKGEDLSEEEELAVRGFVESEAVSPRFVRRVLEEYGDESVVVVGFHDPLQFAAASRAEVGQVPKGFCGNIDDCWFVVSQLLYEVILGRAVATGLDDLGQDGRYDSISRSEFVADRNERVQPGAVSFD